MAQIKIGDNIPSFSLKDQNGDLFDINTYLGKKKLVIFFYPQDGSRNCTREACYFRDIRDIFDEDDSTSKAAFSHPELSR